MLQTTHNTFVSAQPDGGTAIVDCKAIVVKDAKFTVIDAGAGLVAFRTSHGTYLRVHYQDYEQKVDCKASSIGKEEKFLLVIYLSH